MGLIVLVSTLLNNSMRFRFVVTFFALCFYSTVLFSQNNTTLGVKVVGDPSTEKDINKSNTQLRQSVHFLSISIKHFNESNSFDNIVAVDSLSNQWKSIVDNYLRISYAERPTHRVRSGRINAKDVKDELSDLIDNNEINNNSVVIITFLSHGVYENGNYYLICSDTKMDDLANTAISGSYLNDCFCKLSNRGVKVLVFLDTCSAAGIFEKRGAVNSGGIAYFVSSGKDEKGNIFSKNSRFSQAVVDIFKNENKNVWVESTNDYATIRTIATQVKGAVNLSTQHADTLVITSPSIPNFRDEPVLLKKKFVPPESIWEHPEPFSPIAVSTTKEKVWDYILIGVEGASLAGVVVCGPVLHTYYTQKISQETDINTRNSLKQKGKNAAIGCCVCTGILGLSYALKVLHVRNQYVLDFKEQQFATVEVNPTISQYYNGVSLAINF